MKSPKTRAGKKTTGPDDVGQLTRKLVAWAQKLPKKQQVLLQGLLSRCTSQEITIGADRYVIEPKLEQAVRDALAPLGSESSISSVPGWANWVRIPVWARFTLRKE